MALSKLENLYRHVILDHSSHPHNYGTLENADEQIELNNPTCGDVITLQLAMDGDTITAAKFSGHGCSISTASASPAASSVSRRELMCGKRLRCVSVCGRVPCKLRGVPASPLNKPLVA